ncbi:WxL domain-containing protein [Enterococcus sp. DIV0242_7C1]|uniref:WxL domain-containing protein n=1 Tax=Candidatus Enterococcus dunnyi TaxID=1834192 RepID=A0A200IZZ3_9ENTE|nr:MULTISPECIES: WxL domain-containing protein [unclassified Enterococcus]MBO0470109.1 WxL domain-containing protein [Enterococcus sp. DIV0242_7C1]OUZ30562.1 hypothetical protein A5889_002850 [Enterococcus sp. 9D6_DIV0238]
MKLTHKLCGAALVAVAGVALAAPNTTKADTMNGKGHIGFTESTGIQTMTDNSTSKDSSGDTGTGSEITSNSTLTITDPGEFGIISVSPLEFKTHSVLSASQETFTADLYDNGGNKMANFVTYTDKRAENVRATHKLSAKLIQQFQTTSGTQLNGAKITYNNVWVNDYANAVQPSSILNNVTVELNQPSVFINNTKGTTNAGYGQHDVKFGETAGSANADKSVTLDIPKAQNPSVIAGDYNGVVEWTLSETL